MFVTFSGQYDSEEKQPAIREKTAEEAVRALGDHFVAKDIYAEVSLVEEEKKKKVKQKSTSSTFI